MTPTLVTGGNLTERLRQIKEIYSNFSPLQESNSDFPPFNAYTHHSGLQIAGNHFSRKPVIATRA
ncbi:MAG TPA: hypothetical protein VGM46_14025 [Mesorhizobium sp.]|jgi:hypothetical protein